VSSAVAGLPAAALCYAVILLQE